MSKPSVLELTTKQSGAAMAATAVPGVATSTESLLIRPARSSDLNGLADLLNNEILNGTASWTLRPKSREAMAQWIVDRNGQGYPVLVAEDDEVLGFASYGPFRQGEGYGATVEHTVYVAPTARRRGVASSLMKRLISHAISDDYHRMVGAISADQEASIAMHERMGFRKVGYMPEIGRKFDKWLDLVFMMRELV